MIAWTVIRGAAASIALVSALHADLVHGAVIQARAAAPTVTARTATLIG